MKEKENYKTCVLDAESEEKINACKEEFIDKYTDTISKKFDVESPKVEIVDKDHWDKVSIFPKGRTGMYLRAGGKIYLRDDFADKTARDRFIVNHELAHHIDYETGREELAEKAGMNKDVVTELSGEGLAGSLGDQLSVDFDDDWREIMGGLDPITRPDWE